MESNIYREIIREIIEKRTASKAELEQIKLRYCKKYHLSEIPTDADILGVATETERREILPLLRKKPVRTASGIAVVAIMTKPYPCPKEAPCAYCPGGPAVGTPQSYTGEEPAALRAKSHNFDPYAQVKARINQLKQIGHVVEKIDLIVMGGTFTALPLYYQEWLTKRALEAISEKPAQTLKEAQLNAETSELRNVGLTFETRPDYCKEQHVDNMLRFGATRVEIGVQSICDEILEKVERGHSVKDTIEAIRILKDAGLKILTHLMPGLPGSDYEKDLKMFEEVFSNPNFKPDMLKIYPTLVVKGTKLYEWWKNGEYKAFTDEDAINLITEVKKYMPKWIRTMRIQRDIPSRLIEAGVKKSNLGDIVLNKLKELNIRCKCIRCREVGHVWYKYGIQPSAEDIKLLTEKYDASKGEEIFLSFEDIKNDILIGFLRLRIPSEMAHRPEVTGKTALIRELRVYGPVVPIGERIPEAWQHREFGKKLLQEAERIAFEEYDKNKMLITSAIGTREYYRRFGYGKEGPYMAKGL